MQVNFYTYQTNKFNPNQSISKQPSFGAASDITLRYVMDKHSQYLPRRVFDEIKKLCTSGRTNLPKLYELHESLYKPLFEAKTLDQVKKDFPEFRKIIDITQISDNRSKAIKAIEKKMPLEEFTLQYLKDLYRPVRNEDIIKKYGFTNRSLTCWLNEKLNIQKLSSPYVRLIYMSDEVENKKVADMARKAMFANAEAQKYRLQRAAETHRTPEYRAKKRQEMVDFYKRNPQAREKVRRISQETWNNCGQIKEAMSRFAQEQDELTRAILFKKREKGVILTPAERIIAKGFYKKFWNTFIEYKELYKKIRNEVVKSLDKQ